MSMPVALSPLIDREKIAARVEELASSIQTAIPRDERPVAVVVMQGAFIFAADLLRHLPSDYAIHLAFVRCGSYGSGTSSSGNVVLKQDLDADLDLAGRTILLIDDILDTGLTLRFLAQHLLKRGAAKVKVCVLLHRRQRAETQGLVADFVGFPIGSEFVVGYGLDYDGRYRNLPDIAALPLG